MPRYRVAEPGGWFFWEVGCLRRRRRTRRDGKLSWSGCAAPSLSGIDGSVQNCYDGRKDREHEATRPGRDSQTLHVLRQYPEAPHGPGSSGSRRMPLSSGDRYRWIARLESPAESKYSVLGREGRPADWQTAVRRRGAPFLSPPRLQSSSGRKKGPGAGAICREALLSRRRPGERERSE